MTWLCRAVVCRGFLRPAISARATCRAMVNVPGKGATQEDFDSAWSMLGGRPSPAKRPVTCCFAGEGGGRPAFARPIRDGQHGGQQFGQHRGRSIGPMDDNFNLIGALQVEWEAVADSSRYREALRRWGTMEPDLAGFNSPSEVVGWCRAQPDPREANRPVGALLRLAGDPLAARTLLQLIIPG